jgi:hypothetical protein
MSAVLQFVDSPECMFALSARLFYQEQIPRPAMVDSLQQNFTVRLATSWHATADRTSITL